MKKNLPYLLLLIALNTAGQLVDIPIGSSSNQLGNSFGPYTNLWYDADLNSIIFAHRSNSQIWPTSGFVIYDYSTDGGATWVVEQGIAYEDSSNLMRARYPQAVIYNPPGNTVPGAAFVNSFGQAFNGTSNGFYFNGTVPFTTALPLDTSYDHASFGSQLIWPQSGMIVKNTGTTWWAAEGISTTNYNDTIHLSKGIYNASTGRFDYSFQKVRVPVCVSASGWKMFFAAAVAFNDAGDKGYLAVIGNDWVCASQPLDSTLGIIVYQTTDSGMTWNHAADILLSSLDPLLANNGSYYNAGTRFDIGIDKNNTLHIAVPVVPYLPGSTILMSYAHRSWGLFDVTFNNIADACLVSYPQTYFGEFGIVGSSTDPYIQEDNRVQFSRSWDGSKVFFTWFDTDTAIYGPGLNNFPDMHAIGLDVDQQLWTNEFNITAGSGLAAEGLCTFGNVSYYTINDGTNENIPVVYNQMSINTGDPIYFHYIGGAAVSGYTVPGNCMQLIDQVATNLFHDGVLHVSSPYPNPFSQQTSLDITLSAVSDVTVEISNPVGQRLSAKSFLNLPAGVNMLSIDGSTLRSGLYFITVRSGIESVTRIMSAD